MTNRPDPAALILTASTLAIAFSQAAEDLRRRTGSGYAEALEYAHRDATAARDALGAAERALAEADPLGDLDSSDLRLELHEARAIYTSALAESGIDPLELPAAARAAVRAA